MFDVLLNETLHYFSSIWPIVLIVASFIATLTVIISRNSYHRYLNHLLAKSEIEHSLRLIEALHSERHEYLNCLQVMKSMTALGKTEKMEKYLSNVITQMKNSSAFIQIEDPVLAASIATYQVKAKEYNIFVRVNCTTSLKGISRISVGLGEIFDLFLESMIESMTSLRGLGNEISINIQEKAGEYIFTFKAGNYIDSPTISVFPALRREPSNPVETNKYAKRLNDARKKIKELKGKFYYVMKGGHILRLELTVKKKGKTVDSFRSKKRSHFSNPFAADHLCSKAKSGTYI